MAIGLVYRSHEGAPDWCAYRETMFQPSAISAWLIPNTTLRAAVLTEVIRASSLPTPPVPPVLIRPETPLVAHAVAPDVLLRNEMFCQ